MKVRFTSPALAELEAVLDYLAARSPQGAARVQARIKMFVNLLSSHPLIGTRTDDPTIRRLVVRPYAYLVFYEAGEEEVIIHSVRHAARDPDTMPGSVPL